MERDDWDYLVDAILGLAFLGVAITGIIKLRMVMNYLGLEWNNPIVQTLSKIHDISGIALVIFVLIHLILHWQWIIGKTKHLFGIEIEEEKS
ncbi:MAG TPA: DUF4405 domain-containing protein [Candidatus Nanoarchaeia archaeon]|nr:DUF4405 domain-containing protein [Candidatus Nanoarchaeia archaeon]